MAPEDLICPAEEDEMFCNGITTDNNGNVTYSDLAGKFPIEPYVGTAGLDAKYEPTKH